MPEITGPQVLGSIPGFSLMSTSPDGTFFLSRPCGRASYSTYRAMGQDPTIFLIRTIIVSAIVAAGWSYETKDGTPDDALRFIRDQLDGETDDLITTAVDGGNRFGWSPLEMVFGLSDGWIVLEKLKPLLQDLTSILVDNAGNFMGFSQPTQGNRIVPLENALLFPWRMEGTDWHGFPLIENVRDAYTRWNTLEDVADEYDGKCVGTRMVVYYPNLPDNHLTTVNGVEYENYVIAQTIIDELDKSGKVAVPATVAQFVDELDKASTGWRIVELTGKNASPLIMERARYHDVLKVRGMGFPERVVLEGAAEGQKSGTETAQKWAIQNLEKMSRFVARIVNVRLIDPLLIWNYGQSYKGGVYVKASPIADETFEVLSDIASETVKANPTIVDIDSILDHLKIPKAGQVIQPVKAPNPGGA